MTDILISIVIVNYNGNRFLTNCIKSIKKSIYKNYEIIIIDNASKDNSIDSIRPSSNITILKNKINLGFSEANNLAAKLAKGKYIFFLNNDTKILPDTISNIANTLSSNKSQTIYTCSIYDYTNKIFFHSSICVDPFGFPVNHNKIFYAEGSALIVSKFLFLKLGQFDSKYFMFHEDIDLCWRAWLSGYNVDVIPNARINHYAGGSAGGGYSKNKQYQSTTFRRYYSERNNIRTILKNYSSITLLFIFPIYIFINILEIIFFLLTFQPKVSLTYLKAYYWNIINLADTIRQRKIIQSSRKISDWKILSKMYLGIGKIKMFLNIGIPYFK